MFSVKRASPYTYGIAYIAVWFVNLCIGNGIKQGFDWLKQGKVFLFLIDSYFYILFTNTKQTGARVNIRNNTNDLEN